MINKPLRLLLLVLFLILYSTDICVATWVPVSGKLFLSEKPVVGQNVYISFDSTAYNPKDSSLTDAKGQFGFFFHTFFYTGYFIISYVDCNKQRIDSIVHFDITKFQYTALRFNYCQLKKHQRTLAGTVFTIGGSPIDSARIMIYSYNFNTLQMEWQRNVYTNRQGIFLISRFEVGLYILQVSPPQNKSKYYTPSYYPSGFLWQEASILEKSEGWGMHAHFVLQPTRPTSGKGRLTGKVIAKNNGEIVPQSGFSVLLLDAHQRVSHSTTTDSTGFFNFSKIGNGEYTVWTDFPGILTDAPKREFTEQDTLADNVTITFSKSGISYEKFTGMASPHPSGLKPALFPNPVADRLFLTGWNNDVVEIRDMKGCVILQEFVHQNKATIFVGDLPSGQYFITEKQTQYTETFFKH